MKKATKSAASATDEIGDDFDVSDIHDALGIDPDADEDTDDDDQDDDQDQDENQGQNDDREDIDGEDDEDGQDELDDEIDDDDEDDLDDESEDDDDQDEEEEEDGDESDDGDEGRWPEDTSDWAKRQIGKLRKSRREARERVSELENSSQSNVRIPIEPDHPFHQANDETELAAIEAKYADMQDFAESTLEEMREDDWPDQDDDGHKIVKVGEKTYTAAQLRNIRNNARGVLRAAPIYRGRLVMREKFSKEARTAYPWLEDRKSPQRKEFDAAMKALPGLNVLANVDLIVADAVSGQRLRMARSKASTKARKAKAKKVVTARKATAPTRSALKTRRREKPDMVRRKRARQRLESDGSPEALTNFVESLI